MYLSSMKKLPVGLQGFKGIRTDGYLYVDKTKYVYKLATEGKYYFLARPRRFGKNLLVNTLTEVINRVFTVSFAEPNTFSLP